MTLDIIGLGLASLDILIRLKEMPSWQGCGAFNDFGLDGGGMVGTACVAAAHLGARVGYVGTTGSDLLASLKLQSFREAGVDLSHLVIRPGSEGQLVLVYIHAETGERTFSGYRKPDFIPLQVSELNQEFLTSAKYLHLDGFHTDAALQAARWVKAAGGQVCLDGSKTDGGALSPKLEELVRLSDILICASGFGRSLTGQADLWSSGEANLSFGPKIVVQTEGEDGSYTVTATERFHTPAFPVDVVDTTGAGDVFHGAYLVGLLKGWDLRMVACFASAVSAIKCTTLGGRQGIPTFDQTMEFLSKHGVDISS